MFLQENLTFIFGNHLLCNCDFRFNNKRIVLHISDDIIRNILFHLQFFYLPRKPITIFFQIIKAFFQTLYSYIHSNTFGKKARNHKWNKIVIKMSKEKFNSGTPFFRTSIG